jgi:TolA-binding protein
MKKTIILFAIALFLVGCGKKSEQDYLDLAQQNIKNKKVTEAVNVYEEFVKEYPESNSAPHALFEIAALYQNRLVPDMTEVQSLEKSAEYFRKVYENYPESSEAPKSLFLSGFIRANEMNNFDEATKIYNLFLDRYPSHELAAAARQELDNMGLSPDEILQKKVVDQI